MLAVLLSSAFLVALAYGGAVVFTSIRVGYLITVFYWVVNLFAAFLLPTTNPLQRILLFQLSEGTRASWIIGKVMLLALVSFLWFGTQRLLRHEQRLVRQSDDEFFRHVSSKSSPSALCSRRKEDLRTSEIYQEEEHMRRQWSICGGLVAMLVLAMTLTACAGRLNSVHGSGTVTTEVRQVNGFTQVKLSGIGSLAIVQTGTEGLTISAEDNIVPLILTDVAGSVLSIHLKSDVSLQPTKPIVYLLSVKDLSAIMLSGAGTVSLQHLTTNALEVDQSGAGSMTLSSLQLSTFTAKLSGVGSLTASGTTNSQTVTSSGTVSYQADQLQSMTAQVTLSGVGSGSVRVSQSLDITLSGVGSLTYYGTPTVTQHLSGLGKVTHAQG